MVMMPRVMDGSMIDEIALEVASSVGQKVLL